MAESQAWDAFLDRAAAILQGVASDELSLRRAGELFQSDTAPLHPDLRQFFINSVSEVDGFPGGFAELRTLVDRRASEEALLKYISAPK